MAGAPLSAAAMRQLAKDLSDLQSSPPEGIRVLMNEQDLTDVQAEIDGPAGTPYAGGLFRMRLALPADYPAAPPKGFFLTKIYHPNVSKAGEICVNVLKRDWKPDLGLRHVLLVIRCLLIEPFPESALNEEAGKALLEDYEEYCKVGGMGCRTDLVPGGGGHS
jgi:ubiquitin-conjugating enzyme E2 S